LTTGEVLNPGLLCGVPDQGVCIASE
jgi:hypothetical protein